MIWNLTLQCYLWSPTQTSWHSHGGQGQDRPISDGEHWNHYSPNRAYWLGKLYGSHKKKRNMWNPDMFHKFGCQVGFIADTTTWKFVIVHHFQQSFRSVPILEDAVRNLLGSRSMSENHGYHIWGIPVCHHHGRYLNTWYLHRRAWCKSQ